MSDKIFTKGRTVDSFAYDLALTLASKQPGTDSPYELARAVKRLLPDCFETAKEIYDEESPKPFSGEVKFNR